METEKMQANAHGTHTHTQGIYTMRERDREGESYVSNGHSVVQ